MANYRFGFIGTGNMGGALAKAACAGAGPAAVVLANRTASKAEALAAALGCASSDNGTVAREAKFIFLGVKPQMMAGLLADIAPALAARRDRFVLVTMAAGLTMAKIAALAGGDYPVVRIMPNTPVAVGAGMVLCARSAAVTDDEFSEFREAMAAAGRFDELAENLIDAASVVTGCAPAFADLFLESLADGAVECGLPRAKAYEYAAQMLLGSARLALETGAHPGALKDAVCSPGGSTIAGVHALERGAFRAAVMDAVASACQKTKELGK